uniref:Glypican 5a n=1 Tax=Electrophorus electricus TaxID=8005 RepID=A0AAY5ELF5_ELEEL
MGIRGIWVCVCLTALADVRSQSLTKCAKVREAFQLRQLGAAKAAPDTSSAGPDLQMTSSTCRSHNLTCCTKKMEERYQVAARRDFQNLLQKSCSSLKLFLSRSVAAFQEAVEVLVHQVQNHTLSLLQSAYGDLAERMLPPVSELFADVELFVLGAELSPEEAVQRFFHSLFPLVFQQLVEPGLAPLDPAYAECARTAAMGRRGPGAFGPAPGLLAARVGGASLPARLFLQALHLGVEVVNTTARPNLARECRRALLRMAYCPRCQALPARPPCMGYCLNVLRGCLASLAEVDAPWREFVRSLEELGSPPRAGLDLGQALGDTTALVRDAVAHVRASAPWLSAQVRSVCGLPRRETAHARIIQQGSGMRDPSLPLRRPTTRTDDTLGIRTRELLQGLRVYRTFYGGLADQMCVSELASADTITCWNGADMVRSYTQRVTGNGVQAQSDNPEVRVKEVDPIINQVIDKLKHINQLLQGRTIPRLGTLDRIEVGSGDMVAPYSGDCDDEDSCWGSGNGVSDRPAAPKLEALLTARRGVVAGQRPGCFL